jgi:hypothetical protein
MNSLDMEIAQWRQQMLAVGIKRADVLDELESHLREDVERRIRSGTDEARALRTSIQQLGRPSSLKTEFEKENTKRKYMKRSLITSAGIVGILVGMALVMPAVAQYRHEGAMRNGEPWLFLIGSLITLAGCIAAIRSLKKRTA